MNFDELRQRAAAVRAVPLETVLVFRGAERDRQDKSKWHSEQGPLSVTGPKFTNWRRCQVDSQGQGLGGFGPSIPLEAHARLHGGVGLDHVQVQSLLKRCHRESAPHAEHQIADLWTQPTGQRAIVAVVIWERRGPRGPSSRGRQSGLASSQAEHDRRWLRMVEACSERKPRLMRPCLTDSYLMPANKLRRSTSPPVCRPRVVLSEKTVVAYQKRKVLSEGCLEAGFGCHSPSRFQWRL
jgi:hypothetical protein